MPDATFGCPDLTTFARLDELGLEVVGQRLEPDRTVLFRRVLEPDQWCRRCGCEVAARDTGDPEAGARAAGVAAHHVAGRGSPLPVPRLRACVAPRHQPGRRAGGIYQAMITAYREPDRTKGRELMTKLIESLSVGAPAALSAEFTSPQVPLRRCNSCRHPRPREG